MFNHSKNEVLESLSLSISQLTTVTIIMPTKLNIKLEK